MPCHRQGTSVQTTRVPEHSPRAQLEATSFRTRRAMRAYSIEGVVLDPGTTWPYGGLLQKGALFASDHREGGAWTFFRIYRGSLTVCARINLDEQTRIFAGEVAATVKSHLMNQSSSIVVATNDAERQQP